MSVSLFSFSNAEACIQTYKYVNGKKVKAECVSRLKNEKLNASNYQQAWNTCESQGRWTIDAGSSFHCGDLKKQEVVEEKVVEEEIVEEPEVNKREKVDTIKGVKIKGVKSEGLAGVDDSFKKIDVSELENAQKVLEARHARDKAHGKIKQACSGGVVNAGGKKDSSGNRKNTCSLYKPWKRMVVGLVGAGLAGLIAGDANKQYHKASQRIKELERIRDSLADSAGQGIKGCSKNDFDNAEKPTCYCYTSSGSINNNRDPAGICAALFPYYKPPIVSGGVPALKGCVNLQGQFDAGCKCRNQTKNGANNCQKVKKLNLSGLGANSKSLLADTVGATNSFMANDFQGASAANSSNNRSLANFAKKLAAKTTKKPVKAISDFVDSKVQAIVDNPKLQTGGGSSNLGNQGLAAISNSLPNSLKEDIDKKTGGILTKADKGYGSSRSTRRSRSSNNDDEFDITVGNSGDVDVMENEELMAKNYNYKDSDVFKDSSASIFKLLSARYQRSAYKRLFKEINSGKQKDNQ